MLSAPRRHHGARPVCCGALVFCVALLLAAVNLSSVQAQPKKLKRIAIAGLSQLDDVDASNQLTVELERAIIDNALAEVIGVAKVSKRLKAKKRPQLLRCDGEARCLAELGRLVGADWVLAAEAGGLANVQVVHLKLIESSTATLLRSVTATLTDTKRGVQPGVLVKLIRPGRFNGVLIVEGAIAESEIIVDGRRLAQANKDKPTRLDLRVGTHALRVTHPSHSDHVSFVDVQFGKSTKRVVEMKPLTIARNTLEREGVVRRRTTTADEHRPWYARWYVVAALGAVALGGSIAIWASQDGVDADGSGSVP